MASEKTVDQLMAEEATKSRLLALPSERTLGMRDHILIQISFSVATWMLVTGAYIGFAAPFWPALIASLFGTTFPLLFHCYIGRMTTRWGIDGAILARATWGPRGCWVILPFFLFIVYIVWTSIPTVMFGRVTGEALGFVGASGWYTDARIWSCFAFVCSALVLWKSAAVLFWFFRFVTPTIVVVLILLTVRTVVVTGWSELVHIIPEGFDANPDTSFVIGSEIAIGLGFSWVFCFSIYCRLSKSEHVGYFGPLVGWGPAWGLLSAPAIMAALAAGVTDPVYLLEGAGGVWVAIYLIFLFCANIFSAVCTMYIVSLSARTLWPRLPWGAAVLINAFVIILVFWTGAYDQFNKFIALVGATCGPVGMVMVVDYFLKGFKVNIKDVYEAKKGTGYWYWGGVNWLAFVAAIAGGAISFLLYNPLFMTSVLPSAFHVIGAAIPASVAGGVIYLILARLFLWPKRIGFPAIPKYGRAKA